MWIDRETYEALRVDEAQMRGELTALKSRFAAQDTLLDWFRVRLTQIEKERAQMIFQYTGVKIEVPTLTRVDPEAATPEAVLNEAAIFDDVGDEIAKRLGITHNADGTIQYMRKA